MPTRSERHRPAHAAPGVPRGWHQADRIGSSASRGYGYRWQKARSAFLSLHPFCDGPSCPYPSNEVHHRVPHRGDMLLFWDIGNWQALCKECHSAETAREVNERKRVQR